MKRPETRYAPSGDLMIAYQVTGAGNPIDLVVAPGTVSHVAMTWDFPGSAAIWERLASFVRVIRFDKRGTGMSDRPDGAPTLEERSDDIRAVMDAAGSERAYILGYSEGGNMGCVFAATYPERTLGLLLWGVMARWTSTADHPWGPTIDRWRRMVDDLSSQGVTDEYLLGYGAGLSRAELDRERAIWTQMASPAAIAALERMNIDIDTRDILPNVHVPTLVMNRTGDPVAHVDAARDLAARIPGARFVEFPGDLHSMAGFEPEDVVAEIQEFITGRRPPPSIDRVLTTVLFTDIVASTRRAADVGDAAWAKILADHERLARVEIERQRGVLIDSTGDGLLARFDGPARAVRCARAIGIAARTLGLDVRAGAHTGEVELSGDRIRGLAVHIGARVAALAGPSEILVSSTVRDLTVGSGIAYEDRGEHDLKGVPGHWRLFAVVD
jgi:pimeloyl-ACP methyl ester carboxylesterase